MPSKTFSPAFKAHVGEWDYYLCLMSYGQVAREISFLHELQGNAELGRMLQRGIGARTEEIKKYLLTNPHRFLGAIVVAAWGGQPEYIPLEMADSGEDNVLAGVDREFGVLSFNGEQQYFALDGQHRLKAIKDAIKQKPELAGEDIGVIVVPHFNDEKGRQQTRRLFTNINRNAVKTNAQENIALDEDDGFAILTRRFLDEHPFLSQDGVVQVFSKVGDEGNVKLANRQVPVGGSYFTTIGILYDLLTHLGFNLHATMQNLHQRADDQVLDDSYQQLSTRIDQLLNACGNLRQRYLETPVPKDLRAPKGHENDGHPMMRPVVQLAVVRILRHLGEQQLLSWDDGMRGLAKLDWRMSAPPFSAVWQSINEPKKAKGKMITGRESQDLLGQLLIAHLAPSSKAWITRTLANYKSLRGTKYPVPAADLEINLPTGNSDVAPTAKQELS